MLRGIKIFAGVLQVAVFLALFAGCAYFNTFYNAQYYYNQGVRKEEQKMGTGKKDFENSLKKAVVVVRDYPNSRWVDEAFFLIAMDYYWMGNYDKAAVQFEGFIEHFSQSPDAEKAKYYQALTMVGLKNYSEARVALQEMFSSRKFGRMAMYSWADAFRQEQDIEGARSAFSDFLETYPHGDLTSEARVNLAEIQLKGGDTLSAIRTYERHLRRAETSKENYQRLLTLADLYYHKDEYGEAKRTIKRAHGVYGDIDVQCDLLNAKIHIAQGDSVAAEKVLAKIPTGEYRAEAFYILASLYEEEGKFDKAIAYYDTLITRERKSNYTALAERKITLLESRIAQPDSSDTARIDPAEQQFLLAQTYLLSFGDVHRALEEYLKVTEDYPESPYAPKALYGAAWLKRYRLNDTLWRHDFYRLIELYPESPAAQEAQKILEEETPPSDSG